MRFNLLRLVFIAALTAALGVKLLLWVYKPASPVTHTSVAGHEAVEPAGRSVIAGTVYDEHGRPASGRSVRLMMIGQPDSTEALPRAQVMSQTGEEGQYRFEALPAGTYLVLAAFDDLATARVFHPDAGRVDDASPVQVGEGQQRTGIDLRYRPSPKALVEGVVTRADHTPVRITVDLVLARAPEPERVRLTTGTDDQGRFSFGEVPADEYWIVAHTQVRGTVAVDSPIASRPLVAVADLTTTGRTPAMVTLVARPAMTVTARLTFPDIAVSLPDARERSAMVRLTGRDHRSRAFLTLIDTPARSDADGLVTIHGVPAGHYALVGSPSPEWRMEPQPPLTLEVQDGVDVNGLRIAFNRTGQQAHK